MKSENIHTKIAKINAINISVCVSIYVLLFIEMQVYFKFHNSILLFGRIISNLFNILRTFQHVSCIESKIDIDFKTSFSDYLIARQKCKIWNQSKYGFNSLTHINFANKLISMKQIFIFKYYIQYHNFSPIKIQPHRRNIKWCTTRKENAAVQVRI